MLSRAPQLSSTQNHQSLSLEEVRAQVVADEVGKWDTVVPRHELVVREGQLCLPTPYRSGSPGALTPTPWATAQMCQKLGIPTGYYRRCPLELRDAQANHWLHSTPLAKGNGHAANRSESNGEYRNGHYHNGNGDNGSRDNDNGDKIERWTLRSKGETLRGVLSEQYSPLDNAPILEALRPLLDQHYKVDWFGLTDEALHLRVIDPRLTRDVLPGDGLSAGLHVSNSEVGLRAVTVDALVYRLVCSNGLIRLVRGKSLLKQRHIHVSTPRFEVALEEAVQEAVQTAGEFVRQMEAATKQPVSDVEKALEKLGIRFGLSQAIQESAKQSMLTERPDQQHTLYGLINGLTRAAQDLPDEDRYGLETLAGKLVVSGLRGLDGDAPTSRARSKRHTVGADSEVAPVTGHDPDAVEVSTEATPWHLVERAAQMFEGEIVGTVPHGAFPRDMASAYAGEVVE